MVGNGRETHNEAVELQGHTALGCWPPPAPSFSDWQGCWEFISHVPSVSASLQSCPLGPDIVSRALQVILHSLIHAHAFTGWFTVPYILCQCPLCAKSPSPVLGIEEYTRVRLGLYRNSKSVNRYEQAVTACHDA